GFVRDSQYGELWVGRRYSLGEKSTVLQVDTADVADLEKALAELDPGRTRVLRGFDPAVDGTVAVTGEGDEAGVRDRELAQALGELRLVKDEWEIDQLQDAVDATIRGFGDVARALPADRPVSERLVDGLFWARARHDGNDIGYSSIVGNGVHATTLHWTRNDGTTRPGDLLLMDMGVENRHFYTADVTRTIPVSGRFSPLQRELYDIVYASQQAGIEAIRPGVAFTDVHQTCMGALARRGARGRVRPARLSPDIHHFRPTHPRPGYAHQAGGVTVRPRFFLPAGPADRTCANSKTDVRFSQQQAVHPRPAGGAQAAGDCWQRPGPSGRERENRRRSTTWRASTPSVRVANSASVTPPAGPGRTRSTSWTPCPATT